jgi:amidophosphoribosyltransferase
MCAFEFIYFQRPDSRIDGRLIHSIRREMGRRLAEQRPTTADLVIGVPDSAIAAATGFAEAAGLPYADGFVRNRYIGRTFIEPTQRLRRLGARLKYNPLPEVWVKRVDSSTTHPASGVSGHRPCAQVRAHPRRRWFCLGD